MTVQATAREVPEDEFDAFDARQAAHRASVAEQNSPEAAYQAQVEYLEAQREQQ